MGLDATAYSQITLLELLPDDEAAREKYGDREDWDDETDSGPGVLFLSAELPIPERFDPQLLPASGVAVYEVMGDAFAFRLGPYSAYNRWREQLSLTATGLTPERIWEAAELAETQRLPFFLLINFSDCEGVFGPQAAQVLALEFARYQPQADAHEDEDFRELYAEFRRAFELVGDRGVLLFH